MEEDETLETTETTDTEQDDEQYDELDEEAGQIKEWLDKMPGAIAKDAIGSAIFVNNGRLPTITFRPSEEGSETVFETKGLDEKGSEKELEITTWTDVPKEIVIVYDEESLKDYGIKNPEEYLKQSIAWALAQPQRLFSDDGHGVSYVDKDYIEKNPEDDFSFYETFNVQSQNPTYFKHTFSTAEQKRAYLSQINNQNYPQTTQPINFNNGMPVQQLLQEPKMGFPQQVGFPQQMGLPRPLNAFQYQGTGFYDPDNPFEQPGQKYIEKKYPPETIQGIIQSVGEENFFSESYGKLNDIDLEYNYAANESQSRQLFFNLNNIDDFPNSGCFPIIKEMLKNVLSKEQLEQVKYSATDNKIILPKDAFKEYNNPGDLLQKDRSLDLKGPYQPYIAALLKDITDNGNINATRPHNQKELIFFALQRIKATYQAVRYFYNKQHNIDPDVIKYSLSQGPYAHLTFAVDNGPAINESPELLFPQSGKKITYYRNELSTLYQNTGVPTQLQLNIYDGFYAQAPLDKHSFLYSYKNHRPEDSNILNRKLGIDPYWQTGGLDITDNMLKVYKNAAQLAALYGHAFPSSDESQNIYYLRHAVKCTIMQLKKQKNPRDPDPFAELSTIYSKHGSNPYAIERTEIYDYNDNKEQPCRALVDRIKIENDAEIINRLFNYGVAGVQLDRNAAFEEDCDESLKWFYERAAKNEESFKKNLPIGPMGASHLCSLKSQYPELIAFVIKFASENNKDPTEMIKDVAQYLYMNELQQLQYIDCREGRDCLTRFFQQQAAQTLTVKVNPNLDIQNVNGNFTITLRKHNDTDPSHPDTKPVNINDLKYVICNGIGNDSNNTYFVVFDKSNRKYYTILGQIIGPCAGMSEGQNVRFNFLYNGGVPQTLKLPYAGRGPREFNDAEKTQFKGLCQWIYNTQPQTTVNVWDNLGIQKDSVSGDIKIKLYRDHANPILVSINNANDLKYAIGATNPNDGNIYFFMHYDNGGHRYSVNLGQIIRQLPPSPNGQNVRFTFQCNGCAPKILTLPYNGTGLHSFSNEEKQKIKDLCSNILQQQNMNAAAVGQLLDGMISNINNMPDDQFNAIENAMNNPPQVNQSIDMSQNNMNNMVNMNNMNMNQNVANQIINNMNMNAMNNPQQFGSVSTMVTVKLADNIKIHKTSNDQIVITRYQPDGTSENWQISTKDLVYTIEPAAQDPSNTHFFIGENNNGTVVNVIDLGKINGLLPNELNGTNIQVNFLYKNKSAGSLTLPYTANYFEEFPDAQKQSLINWYDQEYQQQQAAAGNNNMPNQINNINELNNTFGGGGNQNITNNAVPQVNQIINVPSGAAQGAPQQITVNLDSLIINRNPITKEIKIALKTSDGNYLTNNTQFVDINSLKYLIEKQPNHTDFYIADSNNTNNYQYDFKAQPALQNIQKDEDVQVCFKYNKVDVGKMDLKYTDGGFYNIVDPALASFKTVCNNICNIREVADGQGNNQNNNMNQINAPSGAAPGGETISLRCANDAPNGLSNHKIVLSNISILKGQTVGYLKQKILESVNNKPNHPLKNVQPNDFVVCTVNAQGLPDNILDNGTPISNLFDNDNRYVVVPRQIKVNLKVNGGSTKIDYPVIIPKGGKNVFNKDSVKKIISIIFNAKQQKINIDSTVHWIDYSGSELLKVFPSGGFVPTTDVQITTQPIAQVGQNQNNMSTTNQLNSITNNINSGTMNNMNNMNAMNNASGLNNQGGSLFNNSQLNNQGLATSAGLLATSQDGFPMPGDAPKATADLTDFGIHRENGKIKIKLYEYDNKGNCVLEQNSNVPVEREIDAENLSYYIGLEPKGDNRVCLWIHDEKQRHENNIVKYEKGIVIGGKELLQNRQPGTTIDFDFSCNGTSLGKKVKLEYYKDQYHQFSDSVQKTLVDFCTTQYNNMSVPDFEAQLQNSSQNNNPGTGLNNPGTGLTGLSDTGNLFGLNNTTIPTSNDMSDLNSQNNNPGTGINSQFSNNQNNNSQNEEEPQDNDEKTVKVNVRKEVVIDKDENSNILIMELSDQGDVQKTIKVDIKNLQYSIDAVSSNCEKFWIGGKDSNNVTYWIKIGEIEGGLPDPHNDQDIKFKFQCKGGSKDLKLPYANSIGRNFPSEKLKDFVDFCEWLYGKQPVPNANQNISTGLNNNINNNETKNFNLTSEQDGQGLNNTN